MPQAAAPPRPRVVCKRSELSEVGLHQCPSERKGEGVPVRSLRVPSHVPRQPQTAAKVRGFSPIASGFTAETDWLLEEAGFELSVPPAGAGLFPAINLPRYRRPCHGRRTVGGGHDSGNRVRTRLPAGGRRIRTLGPAQDDRRALVGRILPSLAGIAAIVVMLRRYYLRAPAAVVEIAE